MQTIFARSMTVSLAMAAVIALPAAVSAQADDRSEISLGSGASVETAGELIGTETNSWLFCVRIVGYGVCCW